MTLTPAISGMIYMLSSSKPDSLLSSSLKFDAIVISEDAVIHYLIHAIMIFIIAFDIILLGEGILYPSLSQ